MPTIVTVELGGTGATSAADARNTLGVMANTGGTFSGAINAATANITTIVTGNALTLSTGTASNGNIIFSSNGTEDMRITNTGMIGIFTTTPNSNLTIVGNVWATTGINAATINATTSNAATFISSAGINVGAQAINAYGQANTARSDANTTFATVNTTFGTSNTTFGTINTNYQAAYAQANTARTTANDAYGAANTRLSASGGTLSGDLIITGNLTVSGNQTILNTEVLTTEDAEIILLSNTSSTPALNAGLIVNRGTSTNTFLRWNEALDEWGWSDSGTTTYYFEDLRQGLSTTNTTFATINTTFATLNTSAGTQNTAITTANDQANTARGQANTAYGQANLAYAQANSARSDANTTFATVNTTFATINTTTATMNTATSNRVLKAGDTMTGNLTLSAASLVLSSTSNDQRLIDAEGTAATGRHVAFPLRFMIGSASTGYPFAGYNAIPRANGAYSYSTSDTAWGISYGNSSRMGFYYAASGTAGANISFSELMSITSGASVGIGTAAPGTRLHVYQTTNDATIRLETTTAGSYFEARSATDGYAGLVLVGAGTEKFFVGSYGVDALQFSRSRTGTEFMRITSGGNVGIATTSPSTRLHIVTPDSAEGEVRIQNSSSANSSGINFYTSTTQRGFVGWRGTGSTSPTNIFGIHLINFDNSPIVFSTTAAERMRITDTGNVGIGTTNPGYKLDIRGAVYIVDNTGSTGLIVDSSGGTDNYYLQCKESGTTRFSIYENSDVAYLNSHNTMVFRCNQTGGSGGVIALSGGTVRPGGDNSQDLGTSSFRWANIYTADLNLSNRDSSNDIDGTWGEWTIQEGETKLYLINRRNGKKYSFVLSEEE